MQTNKCSVKIIFTEVEIMINSIKAGIIAIIPQYTETGDSTYVCTYKGDNNIYNMSIKSFLKKLYFMHSIDLIAQKNKFKKLGIHQNAPIILDDQIFIKVRVRKPIGKSDGAYGYVNIQAVDKIKQKDENTIVILNTGQEIISRDSYNTLAKNLMIGKELESTRRGELKVKS